MDHIRYSVACCQTDFANPISRQEMRANTDRMLSMIDSAVAGAAPFLPVRLIVFPEFAHAAPVFETVKELEEKLAVEIPNEHTERLQQKAKDHDLYIQSGSMLEVDPKWPHHVFNTTCLIGPQGILYKYRKVNTWIPYEAHTSPHDLAGYDEPLASESWWRRSTSLLCGMSAPRVEGITCWLICAVKPTLVIAIIFIHPRILVGKSRTNKIIS